MILHNHTYNVRFPDMSFKGFFESPVSVPQSVITGFVVTSIFSFITFHERVCVSFKFQVHSMGDLVLKVARPCSTYRGPFAKAHGSAVSSRNC